MNFSHALHPSAFRRSKFFSAPFGRIYPIFIWTLRWVRVYPIPNFVPPNFLYGELLAKKNELRRAKGIFESCLYNNLGNANVFELIDGTPFTLAVRCNFFLGQFSSKKLNILKCFQRDLALPSAILNFDAYFLQPHNLSVHSGCILSITSERLYSPIESFCD